MKADAGLVGQSGDPLGRQHHRELAKHAWQTPGRHDRDTVHYHLAPWHLGTVDGHDRHHRHARVGQDLGGLVGLKRDRASRPRSRTLSTDVCWPISTSSRARSGWSWRDPAMAAAAGGQATASCQRPSSAMSCRAATSSGATLAAWRRAAA